MNIPNALSLLRLLMVPVFALVFYSDVGNAHRWAGVIFLAASATDMLDGYIARKYNLITKLGRFLDPLADKLMTATALVCTVSAGIIDVWMFAAYIAKEVLMAIGALLLWGKTTDVMPSNFLGKASTVVFFAIFSALMLFDIPRDAAFWLMVFALLLMFAALIVYAWKMLALLKINKTVEGVKPRKGK